MTTKDLAARRLNTAAKSRVAIDAALIALFVGLLAAAAWIRIPVGPVPVTLQTLVVALAATLLGWKRGTIAVGCYLVLGLVGMPVFSGFIATSAIVGASGGYLVGFLLNTLITGKIIEKYGHSTLVTSVAVVAGLAVCYTFGTVWFMIISGATFDATSLAYVLSVCVVPFLIPDAIKMAVAVTVTKVCGFIKDSRNA